MASTLLPKALLTSPFSGGSPLPKVLVTTRTRVSCSRCTMSYSSMDMTWWIMGTVTGEQEGDLGTNYLGEQLGKHSLSSGTPSGFFIVFYGVGP